MLAAVHGAKSQRAATLESCRYRRGDHLDARGTHFLDQGVAQHLVEIAQQPIAAGQHRYRRSQSMKHSGQLRGNVTGADHSHALGPCLELEESVRSDAVRRAGKIGHQRLAAARNYDVRRFELALADQQAVCSLEACTAAEQRDPPLLQIALVDTVELENVGIALALERLPVVTPQLHVEAVAACIFDALGQRGRVPHDLFRDAADVDAGSPEPVRLDDCSASTMQRRTLRAGEAAAPATDDNQIELLGHLPLPLDTGGFGEPGPPPSAATI